ncbi:hypothetical protein Ab1vBOLIVR4_gp50 [Agrobacterium phage OLIVR4]|nr:hypothetical protein Ab1vBOLIVR4_gp50 [Agrobacterium phage OLIVR4]
MTSKNQSRHKNAYRAGYLDAINRLRKLPRSDELDKIISYLTNQTPPKETNTIVGVGNTVQESIHDAIRKITG